MLSALSLAVKGYMPVIATDADAAATTMLLATGATTLFVALVYLAVRGRNPFRRIDVALAKMRAENLNNTVDKNVATPQRSFPEVVALLFALSIFFVAVKLVEGLVFSLWTSQPAELKEWGQSAALLMVLFWYGIFVVVSRERDWFGVGRRVVHAVVISSVVMTAVWIEETFRLHFLWWGAGGFGLGLFAEEWVKGL